MIGNRANHPDTEPSAASNPTRSDVDTAAVTPRAEAFDNGSALAAMEERWQRTVAELDNVRKRNERRLREQCKQERMHVAAEWLPVLDNLERALGHAEADPAAILEGVMAVREQALDVLERLGFSRIDDVGEPFDPGRHEAAQAVEVPDAEPGTVVAVLRPGYRADSELLRPAVVAVAAKPD